LFSPELLEVLGIDAKPFRQSDRAYSDLDRPDSDNHVSIEPLPSFGANSRHALTDRSIDSIWITPRDVAGILKGDHNDVVE
jgi:hypothetical protein